MLYEWDEEKNRANLLKHGLDFTDAGRFSTDLCSSFLMIGRTTERTDR
jgi:uncharacterized DUF497 family protein